MKPSDKSNPWNPSSFCRIKFTQEVWSCNIPLTSFWNGHNDYPWNSCLWVKAVNAKLLSRRNENYFCRLGRRQIHCVDERQRGTITCVDENFKWKKNSYSADSKKTLCWKIQCQFTNSGKILLSCKKWQNLLKQKKRMLAWSSGNTGKEGYLGNSKRKAKNVHRKRKAIHTITTTTSWIPCRSMLGSHLFLIVCYFSVYIFSDGDQFFVVENSSRCRVW